MPKYKNYNKSNTINPTRPKVRTKLRTTIALRGWSNDQEIKK